MMDEIRGKNVKIHIFFYMFCQLCSMITSKWYKKVTLTIDVHLQSDLDPDSFGFEPITPVINDDTYM